MMMGNKMKVMMLMVVIPGRVVMVVIMVVVMIVMVVVMWVGEWL